MIIKQKLGLAVPIVLAWVLSLVVLIPFALILLNSLKTTAEASVFNLRLPAAFMWENYGTAIKEGQIIRSFFNSLLTAGVSTLLSNVGAAMAAFVMARQNDRMNNWMHKYFFVGLVAVPSYITTVQVMSWLHVLNTYQGIILLFAAQGIPFSVFLFYGFIKTIPRELDEAAVIDGGKGWTLFFRVIFPLLVPVTITGIVLNFMGAWNDFITPLYVLNKTSRMTMIMSMYNFFGEYSKDWNLICSVIVMTLLPIMAFYLLSQKYIVSGMMAGAVKG